MLYTVHISQKHSREYLLSQVASKFEFGFHATYSGGYISYPSGEQNQSKVTVYPTRCRKGICFVLCNDVVPSTVRKGSQGPKAVSGLNYTPTLDTTIKPGG